MHVVPGLVPALGQHPDPYLCHSPEVPGSEGDQDSSPSALFAGSRPGAILASIAAAVEKDWQITVRDLAIMHGLSIGTIHAILKDDLGLVKKSA